MLFPLNSVKKHPIERINDVVSEFFSNSVGAARFSLQLFPVWFREVVNASRGNNSLKNKFKTLFEKFQLLELSRQRELHLRLIEDLDIESLCLNDKKSPVFTEDEFSDLHDSLKVLVNDHLFNQTLKNSKALKKILGTDLEEHYQKFKESNREGRVCPFCGLHEYAVGGENRDAYDHWLCKAKYPLSAINFKNLVPICEKCNGKAVKGDKDILHFSGPRRRRKSFYPYKEHSDIQIQLTVIIPPFRDDAFPLGHWGVDFISHDPTEQQQVENWVETFNLRDRYSNCIEKSLDLWKYEFEIYIADKGIYLNSDLENLRGVLMKWEKTLTPLKKIRTSILLMEAYINYLCREENKLALLTFCNQKLIA